MSREAAVFRKLTTIACCFGLASCTSPGPTEKSVPSADRTLGTYHELTPFSLFEEFADDPSEGDRRWGNRIIRIEGTIQASETFETKPALRLFIPQYANQKFIRCVFGANDVAEVDRYTSGGIIRIRGRVAGVKNADVTLEECVVIGYTKPR